MAKLLNRMLIFVLLGSPAVSAGEPSLMNGASSQSKTLPPPTAKPPLVVPWTPPALGDAPAFGKTSSSMRLLPLPRRYDGQRPRAGFVPPKTGTPVSLGGRKPPPMLTPTCLRGMTGTFPDCQRAAP